MYNKDDSITLLECREEGEGWGKERGGRGTSEGVGVARKVAEVVACLENLPPCGDFTEVGKDGDEVLIPSNSERLHCKKFSESSQEVLKIDEDQGLDDDGRGEFGELVVNGVRETYDLIVNDHLHYIPSGVYDGGPQGAGGVVVNSSEVGGFAPFGQEAGEIKKEEV